MAQACEQMHEEHWDLEEPPNEAPATNQKEATINWRITISKFYPDWELPWYTGFKDGVQGRWKWWFAASDATHQQNVDGFNSTILRWLIKYNLWQQIFKNLRTPVCKLWGARGWNGVLISELKSYDLRFQWGLSNIIYYAEAISSAIIWEENESWHCLHTSMIRTPLEKLTFPKGADNFDPDQLGSIYNF